MRSECEGIRCVTRCVSENEMEELEQWVLLERESKGPNGELKGSTIMAWLNRVLRERRDGCSLQAAFECFLISYQRLVTPVHLLKLLRTICDDPTRHLQAAVLDFLKFWLSAPDLTSSFSLKVSTFAERIEKALQESQTPILQSAKSLPTPNPSKRTWISKGKGSPIPTLKDETITMAPSTPPLRRKTSAKKQRAPFGLSPPTKKPTRSNWVDSPETCCPEVSDIYCGVETSPSDASWELLPPLEGVHPLNRTESDSYSPTVSASRYSKSHQEFLPSRSNSPMESVFGKPKKFSMGPKALTSASLHSLKESLNLSASSGQSSITSSTEPLCPIFPSFRAANREGGRTRSVSVSTAVKNSVRGLEEEPELESMRCQGRNSVSSSFPSRYLHLPSSSTVVFPFSSPPEPALFGNGDEENQKQKQPAQREKEEGGEEEEEEERKDNGAQAGQQKDESVVVDDSEEKGKLCGKRGNEEKGQEDGGQVPSPLFAHQDTPVKRKKFEELPGGMSVKDLVRAFNMYDWEMYCFLEIREFCHGAWTKDKLKAPFLHQFSKTFDQTSRWVSRCVLESEQNFRSTFAYFVEAATKLKKSKNLFRCLSIFSGLAHHAVSRIAEKTILVDQTSEVAKAYGKLHLLFDARNEHRAYRKHFKRLEEQQRVIPFLPVHLRDLIYLEEQSTLIEGSTMLNMEKIQRIYDTILSILQFQDASLGEEERIHFLLDCKRAYLKKTVFQDHGLEELYVLSYSIKPKKEQEGDEFRSPKRATSDSGKRKKRED